MRYALTLVLMLIVGCGDELTAGDDIPPKPSCDRDDVMALMTCPDGYGWVAQWSRQSEADPLNTTREYLAVGDDPGEPWVFEGEYCTEGAGTSATLLVESVTGWQCQGAACSSYRYRVEHDDAVETSSVSCNPDKDAVSLTRTTVRPGEEPLVERFGWLNGTEQGEKYPPL